jgi:hypothetical protein
MTIAGSHGGDLACDARPGGCPEGSLRWGNIQ